MQGPGGLGPRGRGHDEIHSSLGMRWRGDSPDKRGFAAAFQALVSLVGWASAHAWVRGHMAEHGAADECSDELNESAARCVGFMRVAPKSGKVVRCRTRRTILDPALFDLR